MGGPRAAASKLDHDDQAVKHVQDLPPDPDDPLLSLEGASELDGELNADAYQSLSEAFAGEPPPRRMRDTKRPGVRHGEVVLDGLKLWDDVHAGRLGSSAGWIATSANGRERRFDIRSVGSWRLAFLLSRLQLALWQRHAGDLAAPVRGEGDAEDPRLTLAGALLRQDASIDLKAYGELARIFAEKESTIDLAGSKTGPGTAEALPTGITACSLGWIVSQKYHPGGGADIRKRLFRRKRFTIRNCGSRRFALVLAKLQQEVWWHQSNEHRRQNLQCIAADAGMRSQAANVNAPVVDDANGTNLVQSQSSEAEMRDRPSSADETLITRDTTPAGCSSLAVADCGVPGPAVCEQLGQTSAHMAAAPAGTHDDTASMDRHVAPPCTTSTPLHHTPPRRRRLPQEGFPFRTNKRSRHRSPRGQDAHMCLGVAQAEGAKPLSEKRKSMDVSAMALALLTAARDEPLAVEANESAQVENFRVRSVKEQDCKQEMQQSVKLEASEPQLAVSADLVLQQETEVATESVQENGLMSDRCSGRPGGRAWLNAWIQAVPMPELPAPQAPELPASELPASELETPDFLAPGLLECPAPASAPQLSATELPPSEFALQQETGMAAESAQEHGLMLETAKELTEPVPMPELPAAPAPELPAPELPESELQTPDLSAPGLLECPASTCAPQRPATELPAPKPPLKVRVKSEVAAFEDIKRVKSRQGPASLFKRRRRQPPQRVKFEIAAVEDPERVKLEVAAVEDAERIKFEEGPASIFRRTRPQHPQVKDAASKLNVLALISAARGDDAADTGGAAVANYFQGDLLAGSLHETTSSSGSHGGA